MFRVFIAPLHPRKLIYLSRTFRCLELAQNCKIHGFERLRVLRFYELRSRTFNLLWNVFSHSRSHLRYPCWTWCRSLRGVRRPGCGTRSGWFLRRSSSSGWRRTTPEWTWSRSERRSSEQPKAQNVVNL